MKNSEREVLENFELCILSQSRGNERNEVSGGIYRLWEFNIGNTTWSPIVLRGQQVVALLPAGRAHSIVGRDLSNLDPVATQVIDDTEARVQREVFLLNQTCG